MNRIQKIDLPENKRIIAVSDIHGYADYLAGVLKKAHYSEEDALVIVGDMIEKGPESLKTVRYILKLREENENVHATIGNVDYDRIGIFFDDSPEGDIHFLESLKWTKQVWKNGFFLDILEELAINPEELCEENISSVKKQIWEHYRAELTFLWQLPAVLTIGNFIFVHAGIPTDSPKLLQESEIFSYLKTDAFLNADVAFEKNVVVGHWPVCLYRDDIDCMNPIFDYRKHIIAIDGGCALKYGAQLNALLIPHANADIKEVLYTAYDDYPVITAKSFQKAREKTILIRYFDNEVVLLSEKQDMATLCHLSSGREFTVPKSYLYRQNGTLRCNDYSDAYLEVSQGDELSVIERTAAGYIVKKDGVIGWYAHRPSL